MSEKSVPIIGGGIAGIQSAIDLANMGNRVLWSIVPNERMLGNWNDGKLRTTQSSECRFCSSISSVISLE